MSADNGIYILVTKGEYRVIHAQAIENLWWWERDEGSLKDGRKLNPKRVIQYFGKAKVFRTNEAAWNEARKLYKKIMQSDIPVLEYGVQEITDWEDKEFPKLKKHFECNYCSPEPPCKLFTNNDNFPTYCPYSALAEAKWKEIIDEIN